MKTRPMSAVERLFHVLVKEKTKTKIEADGVTTLDFDGAIFSSGCNCGGLGGCSRIISHYRRKPRKTR